MSPRRRPSGHVVGQSGSLCRRPSYRLRLRSAMNHGSCGARQICSSRRRLQSLLRYRAPCPIGCAAKLDRRRKSDARSAMSRCASLAHGAGTTVLRYSPGPLAGSLDGRQAVAQHSGEDVDELAVTVGGADELAADPLEPGRQDPLLERCPVAAGGGARHVVPRVADRSITPERAGMLANHPAVLADLDRTPDRTRRHRVAVVVEANQAGLRHRGRHGMTPVEPSWIGHQACPLRLEHLPDRLILELGMTVSLGVGDCLVQQPGVQLVVALHRIGAQRSARARGRPGSRPGASPSPRPACRRPDRPGNGGTSAGSDGCRDPPCPRRSSPPPSSCSRKSRGCCPAVPFQPRPDFHNLFEFRRHLLSAADHPAARDRAFWTWRDLAGVTRAA